MGLFDIANDWLAGLNDRFADDYEDDGTLKHEVVRQIKAAVKDGSYDRELNRVTSNIKHTLNVKRDVRELREIGAINDEEYNQMMAEIETGDYD